MKPLLRKRRINILIWSVLFSSSFLYGQNTAPFWSLAGNSNAIPISKLGALAPGVRLNIYAGGTQRMVVLGTNGNVGIGPNFLAPQSLLHVNSNSLVSFSQFTNPVTGTGSGDGLKVGVVFGVAQVHQQEPLALQFLTSQVLRMIILGSSSGQRAGFVGIGNGFTNPGNSLEIKSLIASSGTVNGHPNAGPSFGSPTGTSGLRFTNLKSSSVPEANPGPGVLSINAAGDVILVPGGISSANNGVFIDATGAAQLGGSCSTPAGITASHLTSSRVLDLNNNNFQFINGKIGFATGTCTAPRNRVEITGLNANQSGLTFTNLNASSPTISNPGTGLLSVDSNGVVILVSAGAGGIAGPAAANNGISINAGVAQLGGACNDPAAIAASKFSSHRTIDLNGFHLAFGNGTMGFGTGCVQGARVSIQGSSIQPFDRSGLRFPLLTDTASVQPNNSNKVLSVNSSGDVILVSAGTGGIAGAHNGASISTITPNYVAWGQDVGQVGNPGQLLSNREVPMNNFNLSFTDATITPGGGTITIGRYKNYQAKLGLNNEAERVGLSLDNNITVNNTAGADYYGIYNAMTGATSSGRNIGIYSQSYGQNGATGIGIYGVATVTGGTNYGGFFIGRNGTQNTGIYAQGTDLAGYFDGNVQINGTGTINGGTSITSDQQFKTNIDTITNALGIIKQMQPKTFNYDTANVYGMNFSSQKQYGLIAQQVETVLPELVSSIVKSADLDSAGNVINQAITYKALNYNAFIAILMKGMQEQQSKMDSLQNQINNLVSSVNSCCNSGGFSIFKSLSENTNQTDVELNNSQSIVLEQNVPNPFAEQTIINYFLPDNTIKAQMLFYDARGILIKSVDLIQKGRGALNVFAQDLTSGIYAYTLVVDGKIIESKKMVKQ